MTIGILDFILAAPLVYLSLTNSLLEIAFIADEDDDCLVSFGLADIVPLLLDILERTLLGQIEHHQYSMAALKIG